MKIRMLLPALVAAAAFSQAPRPAFTELKANLGLQDAQITQIQQLQRQSIDGLASVQSQVRDKESALSDLLAKGTTDAAAVGKLVLEIHGLRSQLSKARDTARQAALALLFADQKTKLKTLEDAAKLEPAIQQATALWLLSEPVAPAPGIGGPGGLGGPGGRGFGPGRMGMPGMRPMPGR